MTLRTPLDKQKELAIKHSFGQIKPFNQLITEATKVIWFLQHNPPIKQDEINYFHRMFFIFKKLQTDLFSGFEQIFKTQRKFNKTFIDKFAQILVKLPIEQFTAQEKNDLNMLFSGTAIFRGDKLEILLTHNTSDSTPLDILHDMIQPVLKKIQLKFWESHPDIEKDIWDFFQFTQTIIQPALLHIEKYRGMQDDLINYLNYFKTQPRIMNALQQPLPEKLEIHSESKSIESKLENDTYYVKIVEGISVLLSDEEIFKKNWSLAFWSEHADDIIKNIKFVLLEKHPAFFKLKKVKQIIESEGELSKIRIKLGISEIDKLELKHISDSELTRRQKIFTILMIVLTDIDKQTPEQAYKDFLKTIQHLYPDPEKHKTHLAHFRGTIAS